MTMVATKDEIAHKLAQAHYDLEEGIESIYRVALPGKEDDLREPIKLLEVNRVTVPAGVMPVYFGADGWVTYPSVVIDVTPEEFAQILSGTLKLPHGWTIQEKLDRTASNN
jgi:hypothetical protein